MIERDVSDEWIAVFVDLATMVSRWGAKAVGAEPLAGWRKDAGGDMDGNPRSNTSLERLA